MVNSPYLHYFSVNQAFMDQDQRKPCENCDLYMIFLLLLPVDGRNTLIKSHAQKKSNGIND